jgi:hypothetical protein
VPSVSGPTIRRQAPILDMTDNVIPARNQADEIECWLLRRCSVGGTAPEAPELTARSAWYEPGTRLHPTS